MDIIKSNRFKQTFLIFLLGNIFLFIFIGQAHNLTPFNSGNYTINAHHFYTDERIHDGPFNFKRALGQFDAQWYLKIAGDGYPQNPSPTSVSDKTTLDSGLTYAFFPLYPILIAVTNIVFNNLESSALFLTLLLLVASFLSLYVVIARLYDEKVAQRTSLFLFAFPFSIFLRSYYTESLQLILLVWFGYFLIRRNWTVSAALLSLLLVTKGIFLPLILIFGYFLWSAIREKQLNVHWASLLFVGSLVPLLAWTTYNWVQTGSPFYFFSIQNAWYTGTFVPFKGVFRSVQTLITHSLWHGFHESKLDSLMVLATGSFLWFGRPSRKKPHKLPLHPILWWLSLIIFLVPLVAKDTMSFSRFQIVSFPLFLFVASRLEGWKYNLLLVGSFAGLLFTSIYFINWYWVG